MNFKKPSVFALVLVAATVAQAGNVTVSASAGSVAGMNTSGSGGSWAGLTGSASTALIYYQTDPNLAASGSTSGASSELKCVDANGNLAAHTFDGVATSGPNGSTSVTGNSTFSDPSGSAPEYYQASWTASTTSSSPSLSGSGTYDPWVVTAGDVMKLGTALNGTASLYYQTSLLGGYGSSTGFNLASGQTGSYSFDVGVTQGGVRKDFLNVVVTRTGNNAATFTLKTNAYAGFELYALGANAHDDGATPDARITAGTLITSTQQATALFAADLLPNGSLRSTLDFGLVYRNFTLTTNDPNAPILTWNSDTIQTTPEPSTWAALGLGSVAFLRRRKRG